MTAKLPVGIIGLGRMGQVYAGHLATMPEVDIVAVSDVLADHTEAFAAKIGARTWSADYHDILQNKEIEAVFIISPTGTHAEIIMAGAAAGKAMFCEKPIALTLRETDDIIAALNQNSAMLQVGFMRRFDAGYMAARKKIDSGEIGKPTTFKAVGRDPFCPDLNYAKRENSGGLILDMAIHDFDLARWLMGSEVKRVYSEGGVLAFPQLESVGDIDNAVVNLLFENGAIGNVEVSRNAMYGYDIRTEVLGTEGGLNIGRYQETPLVTMTRQGVTHDMVPYLHERFGPAYRNQTLDFVSRVIGGQPPAVGAHDARATLLTGLAATRSYDEARPVELAEFPAGPAAG
jgi:scyllo-inositol 2-dehydrogenase (NAD+)